jgi:hypothetical protein
MPLAGPGLVSLMASSVGSLVVPVRWFVDIIVSRRVGEELFRAKGLLIFF